MGWVGQCQEALGIGDAPGCLARGSLGVQLQVSGGPECEGPCGRCPGAAARHVELTFQRLQEQTTPVQQQTQCRSKRSASGLRMTRGRHSAWRRNWSATVL